MACSCCSQTSWTLALRLCCLRCRAPSYFWPCLVRPTLRELKALIWTGLKCYDGASGKGLRCSLLGIAEHPKVCAGVHEVGHGVAARARGVQLGRPLLIPAGLGFLGERPSNHVE